MTRFASNNTGLLCLFGILVLPILIGLALGYLFIILGVSAYKNLTGKHSREKAVKEASEKIQVVMGDKVVDSSFPTTVSLNVQETKNRSFCCPPPTKYYYHRLCNYSNEVMNGDANIYNDESSLSGEETDSRSHEKSPVSAPDVEDSNSSTHASLEDNLDKTEEEVDREEKSFTQDKDSGVSGGENSPAKRKKANSGSNVSATPEKKSLDLPESNSREINLNKVGFIGEDKTPSPDNTDGKLGKIRFALHYNVAKTELQVNIIKAVDLPITDNKEGINPLVKISLLPQQYCWQRTKIIEGTPDPVFNETFVISGFSKDRIKEYELKFRVVNFHDTLKDRYGDDVIGEILFPLSELKLMENRASFSITKWLYLAPPHPYGVSLPDCRRRQIMLGTEFRERVIEGRLFLLSHSGQKLPFQCFSNHLCMQIIGKKLSSIMLCLSNYCQNKGMIY